MVAIKNLLLFVTAATALATPLYKRTAATILKDISTIDSDIKSLISATVAYTGGVLGALPIANDEQTLETAIKQGTTDAKATSKLSSADSKSIVSAVQGIIPDIKTALNDLVAKKSDFAADGLTSLVQTDLANLKSETDSFTAALLAILSSDTTAQATSEKTTIDAAFQSAINSFAS